MTNTNIEVINLTPHAINFVVNDDIVTINPSGTLARVATTTEIVGSLNGIPITQTKFGEVEGLPDPTPGKVFLVSSLVAGRVPDREDVFIPNESVRDDEGRIIGCKSFGKI